MKYLVHAVLLLSCLAKSATCMAQVAPQIDMSKLNSALDAARVHFKPEDEKTAAFEARRAKFRF